MRPFKSSGLYRLIYSAGLLAAGGFTLLGQSDQPGRRVFEGNCAMCHGSDANGGEFAPGIITRIANLTDPEIKAIVADGIPGRGMPAFKLAESDANELVTYLRTIRAPRRGDLRAVPMEVSTVDGHKLKGVAVNQSFADMQLRTEDGRIHLLRKQGDLVREVTAQRDWPTYDGAWTGNRFSTLDQVNRTNVKKLVVKWTYSLLDTPTLESTPLVINGMMYITNTNECDALDAGTGREIWRFNRPRTKGIGSKVNRGAAVAGDRVFLVTDNAHLLGLNRFTGEVLWETEMADYHQNYSSTSAPLVVGDLVVPGITGGDGGVRGFLAAYDQKTGKEAWRFQTIPNPGEPGSETWNGKSSAHPGGATWFTGTYDAELNLLFWQVGNPGPDHNGDDREGDNLYTDSVVALDPKTGKLMWHYQFTPHDVWDWDACEPIVLVDTDWEGAPRKLLLQANRNGFFYVIDRMNGKLLLAKPFVNKLTWASGVDGKGRPVRNPDQEPTDRGTRVCPAVLGASNWWSTAFDAKTNLYYVQAIESCSIFTKRDGEWQAGKGFMGGNSRSAPSDPPQRILKAIDIRSGKSRWEYGQVGSGESRGGALVTAGGLVIFGEDSGAIMAADSATGKPLWHFQTSQSLRASPMTYMLDGRQYFALASGASILAFGLPDEN